MTKKDISIVAEIELIYKPAISDKPEIKSCLDAYNIIKSAIPENTISLKEQMIVLYMNNAQKVIGTHKLSDGGITSTVCDIRLVLSIALRCMATSFIIGHNHPSGNLQPSNQDVALTLKLKEAGMLMDIKLLDHFIISPLESKYFSFTEAGLI